MDLDGAMTYDTNTLLHRFDFSYLYLGHASIGDRFSDGPGSAVYPVPEHPRLQNELYRLKMACRDAQRGTPVFKVECEGVSYRVSTMDSAEGEVFVLRRLDNTVASLAELGVPLAYARRLMCADLSGLLIVSGAAKAGKTTTAGALVREQLFTHGGIGLTSENPIELPLEGPHGDGICFQTAACADAVAGLRSMLSWGARMIFVGAMDEPALALEMLLAGRDGHLLVTTMRAEDISAVVGRLHALVSQSLDVASVQALIADGLAGVLHQRLATGIGSTGSTRKLETQLFMLRDGETARHHVRQGHYSELAFEIRQQMRSMIHSDALAERLGRT
ncbi:ATPase, T2SS/T4P/T4SS family [Paraburkholderia sediminicola]|uniref:ATPase, T2SS/T4P/T4SS family n=1 Tax=Paraburkholderia sediminicola TaxID=458836 RepID=UPI0038B91FDC